MGFIDKLRKPRYRAARRMTLPDGRPGPEWFDVGPLETRAAFTSRLNEHAKAILDLKGRQGFIPWTLVEPARGYFGDIPIELDAEVLQQLSDRMAEGAMPALPKKAKSAIARGDIFFIEGFLSDGPRAVAVVVMT